MSTAKITTRTKIGAWTADPALNQLEQGDRSVRLEPRAMDVLMHLAARTGEVISLEELMRAVWKEIIVSDSSVYLAISQCARRWVNGQRCQLHRNSPQARIPAHRAGRAAQGKRPRRLPQSSRRRWMTPAVAIGSSQS